MRAYKAKFHVFIDGKQTLQGGSYTLDRHQLAKQLVTNAEPFTHDGFETFDFGDQVNCKGIIRNPQASEVSIVTIDS